MIPDIQAKPTSTMMIDLSGDWSLSSSDGKHRLKGQVPGCAYTDLERAGRIPDPTYRMNEHVVQWVGHTEWVYERAFDVDASWLDLERVLLDCEGLDTFAEVLVNGQAVGVADNMFRRWRFEVRDALVEGTNTIRIKFDSSIRRGLEKIEASPIPHVFWDLPDAKARGWVRKQQSQFGWDWGPMMVTAGIHAPIRLVSGDGPSLDWVSIRQHHEQGRVVLAVSAPASSETAGLLAATVRLEREGKQVAIQDAHLRGGSVYAELTVDAPELWWPAGMGEQSLYDVTIEIADASGETLASASRRIGLRTFELIREADEWGESFAFSVNGRRFFAKGANWVPGDVVPARTPVGRVRRLLEDAVNANMNMIRVWGGGLYESEAFYDHCDELGLCVWQDFMFACAAYPARDPEFVENVRQEAIQATQRLQHRACVCLWCGNNELEWLNIADEPGDGRMSWEEYLPLFDGILADVCAEHAPDTAYWPCSPHKTIGDRADVMDERSGDNHVWGVWHEGKDIDWYRSTAPRFASEFGFQGFPEPRSMASVIELDRGDGNLCSEAVDHRQRAGAGTGRILHDMSRWFRMPRDFEQTLWLTQILQAHCVQTAVEHWRRCAPRTMGALYWQLNDVWTGPSWSSIDVNGRWKALHYAAKRFFAPRLLSVVAGDNGMLEAYLTHEEQEMLSGVLRWTATTLDGAILEQGEAPIATKGLTPGPAHWINVSGPMAEHGKGNLVVWFEFTPRDQGEMLTASAFLARPKHLKLEAPNLRVVGCEPDNSEAGRFTVRIEAERCAAWVWLSHDEVDLRCGDNFVHIRPGVAWTVSVKPTEPMDANALQRGLRVQSLVDTFGAD